MDHYFHTFFLFCNLFFISSYTFYRDFSIFQFFYKKLLNIIISNPTSINLHVYNLVSGIFAIINTIVGNVISFIFVFLGKYICLHYIFLFLLL